MKKIIIIGILIIVIVVLAKYSKKQVVPSEPSNAWNSVQEKADTKIESKNGWVRLWYQIKDFFGESHFIYNLTSKLADNGLVIRAKGEGAWMVSIGTTDVIPDLSMVPYFMIEAKKEAADLYLPFSDFGFRGDHTGDVSMPKPDEVKSLIFTPSLGWSEPGQSHFLEIKEIRTYKKGTPTETDKDGDGIPNHDDYDIDGDGWFNVLEGYAGTDSMDPSNFPDGKLITPSNGCYTGLFITSGATGILEFETLTGMKPAIINLFPGWEINQDARLKMDRPFLEWIWRHGSIPRHSWFPEGNVRIQDILDGKHDQMLTALAREVKALKQPIVWPYGVEVDGSPLEPSNALWNFGKDGTDRWFEADDIFSHYGDPNEPDGIERWKDYVAYVRKVFDRHGVNNVVYLFHTLGVDYTESGEDILSEEEDILGEEYPVPGSWNTVANYYPGTRLVDWVGFSLNGPGWNGIKWMTIDDILDESYLKKLHGVAKGKPIMIPEFSFFPQTNWQAQPPQSRAELFSKVFNEIKTKYPSIKAWTFGNTRSLSPPVIPMWVVAPYMGPNSPPDEIEAFRKAVTQDPYFLKDPILFPKSKNSPAWNSQQEKTDDEKKHVYIGQFILAAPDLKDFMEKIGSAPPIVFFGVDWVNDEDLFADDQNPAPVSEIDQDMISFLNKLSDMGSIPAIAWSIPVVFWDLDPDKIHLVPNIPRILNGEFDDYIRTVARQLKEYGKPIMLTFLGEFNNHGQLSFGAKGFEMPEFEDVKDLVGKYGDPKWPDGPERVRDVFIHVIDIFRQEGANNISWFMYGGTDWLVKNMTDDKGHVEWWSHPKYYYPGDEYIDWVGKSVHFTTFAEFKNRFEGAYDAWGEVTQRPFYIPEFSFHEKEKSRSKLMQQIFLDYLPTKPRFKAATFYHSPIDVQMDIGFGIPLGGKKGEFPDEIQTWKEVVVKNPYYHSQGVMEQSQ